ncbi:MAG: LysE family transporter [Burkholderiales bacterium]|uniref:LysE family transporter n=1 Tax=Inhella sp. TaxID=1921806 RepID=UPI001ACF193C|nr:LysE family transporter [Burkholderiales bacterium]
MFGIADYWAFVLAVWVFLMIPGPGNLVLIGSTGKGGVRGGLAATAGVMAGDQLLMWSAVAGVAAVLKAAPALFAAVQWLGAAYLVWLGLKMMRARAGGAPALQVRPRQYFQQAFVITLFNPKAIVFYMAFFPQFVHPTQHQGLLTFGAMAVTVALITLLYCVLAIALTRLAAERLRASPIYGVWLERVAGGLLLGFGIKLALGR